MVLCTILREIVMATKGTISVAPEAKKFHLGNKILVSFYIFFNLNNINLENGKRN